MEMNVVEQCEVWPSEGGAPQQILPLLYFDILWLPIPPMETLYFYSFKCSKSHFLDTIVPKLKNSLSLTLKHFLPLAGNILFPLSSSSSALPVSHYVAGDSVSLTISVSPSDFFELTGNHSRDADHFHHYVPQMPRATYSTDLVKFPVMALQVTLFPDQGICIGFTNHHAIADGATMACFLQAWASINKFNGDAHLLALGKNVLPCYDRSVVEDARSLTNLYWDMLKTTTPTVCSTITFPTNKVRATFLVSEIQIQKLKLVVNKKLANVSSFSVVCGYLWSCLVKSAAGAGEEVADDEAEYFAIPVDCRKRLNPPLPDTYFGNCLILVLAESTHGRLKGKEGFVAAVMSVSEAIRKGLDNERGILDGSGDAYLRFKKVNGKRNIGGIAGSPRFEIYGLDYGWGVPKKFEALNIDTSGSATLSKTREGIFEIGLSMPRLKMDAFAPIFNNYIRHINSTL